MKISNEDIRRLEFATSCAVFSDHKYKIGAALYSGGRMLARGTNSTRMVDMEPFDKCMEHAEESAMRQMKYIATGGTIYIARVNALGEPRLAIPCHRCIALLTAARVSRIVWTTDYLPQSARTRDIANLRNKSDEYRKAVGICQR